MLTFTNTVAILVLLLSVTGDATRPSPIYVTGMCSGRTGYNGRYDPMAVTSSGRWWYQGYENSNRYTLYWDATCDGAGNFPNSWIFDSSEPSVVAASDLDGDSTCAHAGDIPSTSLTPPGGTWTMACDGAWTSVAITIATAVECNAGQGPDSSNACEDCDEGEYSDSTSTDACTPCPQGTYNPDTASSAAVACTACVKPDYSDLAGSPSCSTCLSDGVYVSTQQCLVVHSVATQTELHNKFSQSGTDVMGSGDSIEMAEGTYTCGLCAHSDAMLQPNNVFGELRCADDDQLCVMDGEEQRGIIVIRGTGVGTLTLRGIKFQRGTSVSVSTTLPLSTPSLLLAHTHTRRGELSTSTSKPRHRSSSASSRTTNQHGLEK